MTTIKHYKTNQKSLILKAFRGTPKTMLQVARITGIERANICRRVAELQDQNRIVLVCKSICPITKARAGFYIAID